MNSKPKKLDLQLLNVVDGQNGWGRHDFSGGKFWVRGHGNNFTKKHLIDALVKLKPDGVCDWLASLDGHYSLVAEFADWFFAASDHVRSYPLIWTKRDGVVLITHSGVDMEIATELGVDDIDSDMAVATAMSGFTIGDATLYRGVRQVGPGQVLIGADCEVRIEHHHQWQPWKPRQATRTELIEELSAQNLSLMETLANSVNGRQILLPLSAGLDSRFIASGLKQVGYDNVWCVAYGRSGNREVDISREVADRLGFRWTFVPYVQSEMRRMFHADDYKRYKNYSDSLTSMHFPQEYRLITELIEKHNLSPEAVIVNGQSGDFISGNHVPKSLFEPSGELAERLDIILSALHHKHYKHWRILLTEKHEAIINRHLTEQIDSIGGLPEDPAGDHGIYEYCEYQDRQSKYVLNGQRVYEYFGLDWRLPLWDKLYVDFWACAPVSAKKNQNLYKEVLHAEGWGGVWKDLPINPSRIRPHWLLPIRFAAKLMHAPLGQEAWHRFEKSFFEYWMAATCVYAAWPYGQVALDRRGHTSGISWHASDYLESHGLKWNGRLS